MVGDARHSGLEAEARAALAQHYGTANVAGHLAAVVLVLLEELRQMEQYCARVNGGSGGAG